LSAFVLDASIAIKWAIPATHETLAEESLHLLEHYTEGKINFIVPDFFWAEVGNVLWKGVRLGRWRRAVAETASSALASRDFYTVPSSSLLPEALQIAFAYDRTVYDCLYIALAVRFKTEMITADMRLANAVAAHLPVKWLGSFTLGR
jgi:predicted nucleic acid-binding protein